MPKTVEITEEEYARSQALSATLTKILADPKAKLLVQQAQKLVDPTARTPDLDRETALRESTSGIEKRMSDFLSAQEKDKADRDTRDKLDALGRQVDAGKQKLRSAGWTDDGIKAVEKLMEERGITDPEIAAAYHEKMHPPQTPVQPGGQGAWNFLEMPTDGDADLKRLVETKGESVSLIDKMASEALAEVRGQRR